MIPLTDEENKSYKKQKVCYIWKKWFSTDFVNDTTLPSYNPLRFRKNLLNKYI